MIIDLNFSINWYGILEVEIMEGRNIVGEVIFEDGCLSFVDFDLCIDGESMLF